MIEILEGVQLNPVIERAVANTVDIDIPGLTHVFYSSYVVIQFNNDTNDYRMFYTKNEYIEYLMGMYEEGAMFGDKPIEYREACKRTLNACMEVKYLRKRLEFSFDEMKAITEHYQTGWFSDMNMTRWGTELIRTMPYRMFVTRDKGYDDGKFYNLRIITVDGYIVTLLSLRQDVCDIDLFAEGLVNVMSIATSRERAIVANLQMVWNVSTLKDFKTALTYCDFNGNSFTVASDDYCHFEILR